jgi:hypothetical protein
MGRHNSVYPINTHTSGVIMTASSVLSASAIASALAESPEYKALVLKFEQEAAKALTKDFEVKSLGVTMSLARVAVTYQVYKAAPKALGDTARAYTESVSRECLAIIKGAGYKADWNSIVALAQHA